MRLTRERAFRGALRLVVGGLGSRCGLAFDRVDELQLAIDALLDHRVVADELLTLEASIGNGELALEIGPFVAADDPAGRRVAAALVGRLQVSTRDGHEWIELAVALPEDVLASAAT